MGHLKLKSISNPVDLEKALGLVRGDILSLSRKDGVITEIEFKPGIVGIKEKMLKLFPSLIEDVE